MHKTSHLSAVLTTLVAAVAFTAPAAAAPITIGSPLTAPFGVSSCNSSDCTVVATGFDESGAVVRSPVDGTVVRWHIISGSPNFQYRLRVVAESPGEPSPNYTGSGISAPATPSNFGLQTFATSLPIRAGQLIGIDLPVNAPIGYLEEGPKGDTYAFFEPPLAEGATQQSFPNEGEVAFNAEIQRPPVVSGIAPAAGSFKGGTAVTITGSEFTGATAVGFGALPAQSFSVDSDTQITAVAPAMTALAKVGISVTTAAGTGTSATTFQAQACKVPNLKGKKLKRAKKRSRKALCKVGKVKKIEGATAKTGKVVKQRPKPGKVLAPGAKVKLTLAP